MTDFQAKILELKQQKNAVIIAHYYQRPEIQDIADYVGDSLGMAQQAAASKADIIVVCGVKFMAETAAILCPTKKVLLPDPNALCPLAAMAKMDQLTQLQKEHPGVKVVSYVNTTADIKAASYICCTSSNAVKVVASVKEKDIIFLPDKNLGDWVQKQLPDRKLIIWDGYCPTHHSRILPDHVQKMQQKHPWAKSLAHPECRSEVLELIDFTGSTSQIIEFAKNDTTAEEYIICTEEGVIHQMKKNNPKKNYYLVNELVTCQNMKMITINKVYISLLNETQRIEIVPFVARQAKKAIDRMLAVK